MEIKKEDKEAVKLFTIIIWDKIIIILTAKRLVKIRT